MVPVKVPLLLNSTLHSCLATTSDVLSRDFRFTAIRDYLLLMMPIELPDDVFLVIFLHLHWKEIRQMRLTCRKCHRLTKQKSLWQRLLQTQILDNNVPVPGLRGLSLENGTSEELELLVINAQELRRKWTSPSPVPKRTSHLQAPNSSRVIRLHFLKIPDRKWLLSLSAKVDPGHRRFWLQLWDLAQYPPISIATQEIHNLNSMAVNEVHDASGVVAIHAMSSVSVYSITPQSQGRFSFTVTTSLPIPTPRVHLFSGTKILSSDDHERLYWWDLERPQVALQLRNLEAGQHQRVLEAIMESNCMVVFRSMTIELYPIPAAKIQESGVVEPVVQHRWPWKLDSLSVTKLHPSRAHSNNNYSERTSIGVLIRFGSTFPWPVNLLHQMVIHVDLSFRPLEEITAVNSPYRLPPVVQQIIGAPVRLFSLSDLALGPYGTALWIDTHTENLTVDQVDRGQRLASKFTPLSDVHEELDEGVDVADQTSITGPSSIILYNDGDDWSKVGLDEEEGMIAIGHTDGRITVLDFV